MTNVSAATVDMDRTRLLGRALRLELFTVGWNLVEGVVAVLAALLTGSVALLGFGMDSFVESASAGVLIWRLRAERAQSRTPREIEALDERAQRLVGASLFLLAGYVAIDALQALANGERPAASMVGIVVTTISIGVMWWLAREKRSAARRLGSRALEADSFQTTAFWWLSIVVLAGLGLNALFGWWWADPVAALGIVHFLVREGRDAWNADRCCA
jgi:divalent metal cation (Fe/Co/Zn/Cd) transporter